MCVVRYAAMRSATRVCGRMHSNGVFVKYLHNNTLHLSTKKLTSYKHLIICNITKTPLEFVCAPLCVCVCSPSCLCMLRFVFVCGPLRVCVYSPSCLCVVRYAGVVRFAGLKPHNPCQGAPPPHLLISNSKCIFAIVTCIKCD